MKSIAGLLACLLFLSLPLLAQEQDNSARVFITDSRSWELSSGGGGADGVFGTSGGGGARPQTAEIIKTFRERCPQVLVNNIQAKANYIVTLDHEGGKGILLRDTKIAVFERLSGDSIISKSTRAVGSAVQTACLAITQHWNQNSARLRAAATQAPDPRPAAAPLQAVAAQPKLSVISTPDGADIEVDGSFMGNTPSSIELTAGDHTVVVKKAGYAPWERKLKLTGGDIKLNAELQKATSGN